MYVNSVIFQSRNLRKGLDLGKMRGKRLGHLSLQVLPSWGGSGVLRVPVPKALPKCGVLWEQHSGRMSALIELERGTIDVGLINVD